ncbi:hypothetical protein VTN31DRAFT_871 [Thermomyces dupontii]|uniref:uncharacterized protein n=1 Tax=Talaromyces thermophilus TaxID=28565 RepID=UPI00374294E8
MLVLFKNIQISLLPQFLHAVAVALLTRASITVYICVTSGCFCIRRQRCFHHPIPCPIPIKSSFYSSRSFSANVPGPGPSGRCTSRHQRGPRRQQPHGRPSFKAHRMPTPVSPSTTMMTTAVAMTRPTQTPQSPSRSTPQSASSATGMSSPFHRSTSPTTAAAVAARLPRRMRVRKTTMKIKTVIRPQRRRSTTSMPSSGHATGSSRGSSLTRCGMRCHNLLIIIIKPTRRKISRAWCTWTWMRAFESEDPVMSSARRRGCELPPPMRRSRCRGRYRLDGRRELVR